MPSEVGRAHEGGAGVLWILRRIGNDPRHDDY